MSDPLKQTRKRLVEDRPAGQPVTTGPRQTQRHTGKPSRELGDTEAKITYAAGIARAVRVAARAIGKDCGGDGRQKEPNEKFPYQHPPPLPASGLISPSDQWCVQIDITNACPNSCANCERFVRLVPKPFAMDVDTFQRAVDSMEGYRGVLGIMGGEPTLHPQFEQLVAYYRDRWHPECLLRLGREALFDFPRHVAERLQGQPTAWKRGLFTSLGEGYYRHYELIQDTFDRQYINTHRNAGLHQALLVTRSELQIPDDAWMRLRDKCWIQRLWSSSITPKGAYFCEIAGALDMLYDSLPDARRAELGMPKSGGWPVEPGWWQREQADFGEQLGWCEFCGGCLATPHVLASGVEQQVSPWHAERLKEIGSPIQRSRLTVLDPGELRRNPPPTADRNNDRDWYMPKDDKSRRACGISLSPRRIEAITVSVDCADQLARTLPRNVKHFDCMVVVTATHDTESQRIARECGAKLVVTDACYEDGDAFNKGRMMNAGLDALRPTDWVLFTDADCFLPNKLGEDLRGMVLNPGCLYYTRRYYLPTGATEPDPELLTGQHLLDPGGNRNPWGYFQLVHVRAQSLRASGFRYPTCFCSAGTIDHWFMSQWPAGKRIMLPQLGGKFMVFHLWHGALAGRWNGRRKHRGWRYAAQTDLNRSEVSSARRWPVPCLVRRICVQTLETEVVQWNGGEKPAWSKPVQPGLVYEFSVKELDNAQP